MASDLFIVGLKHGFTSESNHACEVIKHTCDMSYADRFNACLNRPGKSRAGVAAAMGVSVQAVGAICRGATKSATAENNAKAAAYFGCDAGWLATGTGSPGWSADGTRYPLGVGVAHDLTQDLGTVPPLVVWGELMADHMPTEFRSTAPDDALAPRLRAGQVFTVDTQLQPRAGDGVLLKDRTGAIHLRVFRPVVGRWEAHALQPDWPVMDSERDGLMVLAVLTGVQARWG